MSTTIYQQPDAQGYYGQFGGAYIPEMLHRNVEELRNQYSIGYTPTNNSDSTGFRRITLNVKDGSAKVYSRAGYYPRPK